MRLKAAVTLAFALGATVALAGAARAADPTQQEKQLVQGSVGHQDGQLQKVEGNSVTLQPYQKKAGIAQLQASADTKVYAAVPNGLVSSGMSSAVLNPGANVRVYFKPSPDGKQQMIVAIQLLPADEALKLQASQSVK